MPGMMIIYFLMQGMIVHLIMHGMKIMHTLAHASIDGIHAHAWVICILLYYLCTCICKKRVIYESNALLFTAASQS